MGQALIFGGSGQRSSAEHEVGVLSTTGIAVRLLLDIVNREEEGDTRAAVWLLDVSLE
jgi:hypothetical protein